MKRTASQPEEYDLVVLGSGAAGKLLSWTLAKARRKSAVVERKYVGGSCPNIACLPSKNIIHSAKVISYFRRGERLLHGKHVVINTGTHATIDATPGLLEAKPLTHVEALELDRTPEHLLVLGGGFVGLEFAQAMRRYSGRPISENSFSSLTLPAVYVNPRYSKASDKYIDLKEANFDAQRCAALAGII